MLIWGPIAFLLMGSLHCSFRALKYSSQAKYCFFVISLSKVLPVFLARALSARDSLYIPFGHDRDESFSRTVPHAHMQHARLGTHVQTVTKKRRQNPEGGTQ